MNNHMTLAKAHTSYTLIEQSTITVRGKILEGEKIGKFGKL